MYLMMFLHVLNFVKFFVEVFWVVFYCFLFVVVFVYIKSGLSRELFEQWCTDRRNGVIIAGYCVEGTLAKVYSYTLFLHCSLTINSQNHFSTYSAAW